MKLKKRATMMDSIESYACSCGACGCGCDCSWVVAFSGIDSNAQSGASSTSISSGYRK